MNSNKNYKFIIKYVKIIKEIFATKLTFLCHLSSLSSKNNYFKKHISQKTLN